MPPSLSCGCARTAQVDAALLGAPFVEVARHLPWAPTPRADDDGVDFALAAFDRVRDLGDVTAGIMFVRPHRQYPLHHHPPHELYLTIAGDTPLVAFYMLWH